MLNINNQAFITVKIDGEDLNYANIKNITLAEGNGVLAPTVKIELDDPQSVLATSQALSDGNTIEILVARSTKDTTVKPKKYRVFGVTRENASYNANLAIVGLLNAPLYFTASARESHVGTSASVLSAVASKCGLKYVGPANGRTLNDKQIWLDVATTRAKFVFEVTRHGWMDTKSCMGSIVTSNHELRYKNLVDEINTPDSKIKFLLTHSTFDQGKTTDSKKHYIVKEARDKSSAGVMANWMNYGSTRGSNNIDGLQKNVKDLAVHSPSQSLAINKEVVDLVKRSRIEYSPIDCTNTHKEYQGAFYQNIKISALFTESMSLLLTDVTEIQLYDMIVYRQADADPRTKVRNEDKYLVIGKTIVIRGGIHYAERLQCVRMSLTITGNAPMCTNMKDTSVPSLVPESSINYSAMGVGLEALNGLRTLSGSLSSIKSLFNSFNSGNSAGLASNLQAVSETQNALSVMQNFGSTLLEVITAVNGATTAVIAVDTSQTSNLANAGALASATITAVSNLVSPGKVGSKTDEAQSAAAPAFAAESDAALQLAAAVARTAEALRLWTAAKAAVASAKPGLEKAALIANAQRLYNVYYDIACRGADVAIATKPALDAAKEARYKIEAAQKIDEKNSPSPENDSTLAKAALSTSGGCIDATSSSIVSAKAASTALVEVWSLVGETPTKYMTTPECKALTESCQAADAKCKAVMAQGIKTANMVMGAVAKVTPPDPMPSGHSASMVALSALIAKPGVTQGQITQFLTNLNRQEKSGSTNWLYYTSIGTALGTSIAAAA